MRYSAAFGRQETIMYKKFDLEAAKNGAPVITGTECPVRIICFDRKGDYPIVALIGVRECEIDTFRADGRKYDDEKSDIDLRMAPIKKKGWINIYPHFNNKFVASCSDTVYESKEIADSFSDGERIARVEIEWSE
jgi:hypothetical protein